MEKLVSKIKQIIIFQLFTILLRYVLGGAFVYASIFKILGIRFTPESGENAPINTLPHFMEAMYQSGYYWYFIGWGQLIIGFLLISQLFSTLGAVAFFPLMLNIVIITTSFDSVGILTITCLMLLANIYLLLWDWNKLKFIVLPHPQHYADNNAALSKQKAWVYLGLLFFSTVVLYRLWATGHF